MKIAQMSRDMAKTVYVDSARRYVFIGEDPADEDTGLIVYDAKEDLQETATNFFSRWDFCHTIIMEHQVYTMSQDTTEV